MLNNISPTIGLVALVALISIRPGRITAQDRAQNYQSQPSSPCPVLFRYLFDGNEWFGMLEIPYLVTQETIKLTVLLSVQAQLPTSFVGQLDLYGSNEGAQREIRQQRPVRYRVRFPVQSPLPSLKGVECNGRSICSGRDEYADEPGVYITKIRLEHSFFTDLPATLFGRRGQQQSSTGAQDFVFHPNGIQFPANAFVPASAEPPTPVPVYTQPVRRPSSRPVFPPSFTALDEYGTQSFRPTIGAQTHPEYVTVQPQPEYGPVLYGGEHHQPTAVRPQQQPEYVPMAWQTTQPPVQTELPTQRSTTSTTTTESNSPLSEECGRLSRRFATTGLIAGGKSITRGTWPWLTAVYINLSASLKFICGGNLVSRRVVLSAAHCFRSHETELFPSDVVIFLGRHNIMKWSEKGSVSTEVEQIHLHPEYMKTDDLLEADLAVVVMSESVAFSDYIRPICLWEGPDAQTDIVGASGTIVGWGRDNIGNIVTPEPKMISLPIVSEAVCLRSSEHFRLITSNRTFCAGRRDGFGPCNGDSGSGMAIYKDNRIVLRGIVSSALSDPLNNMCNLNEYVVFTDAAKFGDWIRSFMSL